MKKQVIIRFGALLLITATLLNCRNEPGIVKLPVILPGDPVIFDVMPQSGQMGTLVAINGNGFSTNPLENFVKFGNVEARVVTASATQLIIEVPKDAETNPIEVEVEADGRRARCVSSVNFEVKQILPEFKVTGDNHGNEIENLSGDFARVSSTLVGMGSRTILQHGHVWSSTAPSPNYDYSKNDQTELGSSIDREAVPYKFTSYVRQLEPNTVYTIRAYVVTIDGGTSYGPITQFRTTKKVP